MGKDGATCIEIDLNGAKNGETCRELNKRRAEKSPTLGRRGAQTKKEIRSPLGLSWFATMPTHGYRIQGTIETKKIIFNIIHEGLL